MLLSIDMISEVPIYTQLCHQIIRGIALKEFNEGDELPSVRNLAKDIGVNLHTVNKAYNILKQDGFLVVNRRKGVVVNTPSAFKGDKQYKNVLKESMTILVTEAVVRGLEYDDLNDILKSVMAEMKGEIS